MAKDEAYRKAEKAIEIAHRSRVEELYLDRYKLTELPESVGQLTQLQRLGLSGNILAELPESVGQLTQLQWLDISGSLLKGVPESMSRLTQLKELYLRGNQLTEVPESMCQLTQLQYLDLGDNSLTDLPESICRLAQLKELCLRGNQLTELPESMGQLMQLQWLDLDDNPLNPELKAAYGEGIGSLIRYLREMAKGGRARYEAKLLILGDGNVGKTCVSRALRGLPFCVQNTTRGVDVAQWRFSHPDEERNQAKEITLNIWDFEGQEIAHQTHQFFLTSQALYLVVFRCRDQFSMEQAEYWLDTIRARAPLAKVVIVMSECEERLPHIPLDRIKAQYGDLLADEWFFAVGCENGRNVDKLRAFLRASAVSLPFMGDRWPKTYEEAETKIIAEAAKDTAHISRAQLHDILQTAGVSGDNYEGAAGALARIGAITQFPDCPELRDFVVLKPQWLTKAISKVMENKQLADDRGEIAMQRMEVIWSEGDCSGMFATFHNCMKEFELCYDLEDMDKTCLVPLRFGYEVPAISWTEGEEMKERRMEYKLNIRPPMGIMSRFIVKTHHLIVQTLDHPKGIYWHNGVFLRTNSPFPSEALCEFLTEDRIFRVRVRAAFPQNLCEQIHGYIQAVFSFFAGLSAERSYGCIKLDAATGSEVQCAGLHTEKRIYTAISKQREVLDCEFGDHEVDPRLLVSGICSFAGFVRGKLMVLPQSLSVGTRQLPEWAVPYLLRMEALLEWVHQNGGKLDQLLQGQMTLAGAFKQESELKLREYLAGVDQLLDDRDRTEAPGLISIVTKDRSGWNPVGYFRRTYILTPFCEAEGKIHACADSSVEFTRDRDWWQKSAPWVARATKVLAAGLKLAFGGLPLALGAEAVKVIEDEVKFMEALTDHLALEAPEDSEDIGADEVFGGAVGKDLRSQDREAAVTRAALARFLEATAPDNYRAKRWGSLRRVRMSDNSHRWLCEACARKSR